VVTPDELISALQGRLQLVAEKAAEAAIAKRVNDAVREALTSIDNARQSSMREVQELFPKRVEEMKLSLREESSGELAAQLKEYMEMYRGRAEEMAQRLEKQVTELQRELANAQEFVEKMTREIEPQIHARLNEAVTQSTLEFDGAAARVVERRYERLLENTQFATQEALLKVDARSAEVQALMQNAVNSALGAFQRQTELHVNMTLAETKERAVTALSSLDAESRANWDMRRQALEMEVARSAERSTEQFRKGMKAFLYSCLVAAVSAVDEHSKSTLEGLLKDNGKTLREAGSESRIRGEDEIIPDRDDDPITH
jgi:recombination DNA repair RAD52 pathway protein